MFAQRSLAFQFKQDFNQTVPAVQVAVDPLQTDRTQRTAQKVRIVQKMRRGRPPELQKVRLQNANAIEREAHQGPFLMRAAEAEEEAQALLLEEIAGLSRRQPEMEVMMRVGAKLDPLASLESLEAVVLILLEAEGAVATEPLPDKCKSSLKKILRLH